MMTQWTILVAVTPLSVTARAVGCLLGLLVVFAAAFLLYTQRSAKRGVEEGSHPSFAVGSWLRTPNTILMAVCGVGMIIGTLLIDPSVHPRVFIGFWCAILLIVLIMFLIAFYDLLFIRRGAVKDRIRLLQESRDELQEDLKQYMKSRSHRGNGQGAGPGTEKN